MKSAILVVAIVLHYVWGITLLFTTTPEHTTPISQTIGTFGQYGAASVYLAAASLAALGLLLRRWKHYVWFLLPQQATLLAAAIGITYASSVGHYADGTVKPGLFIFMDQLPALLLIIFHTIVVFTLVVEENQ